jgi:hypothetical protein
MFTVCVYEGLKLLEKGRIAPPEDKEKPMPPRRTMAIAKRRAGKRTQKNTADDIMIWV